MTLFRKSLLSVLALKAGYRLIDTARYYGSEENAKASFDRWNVKK